MLVWSSSCVHIQKAVKEIIQYICLQLLCGILAFLALLQHFPDQILCQFKQLPFSLITHSQNLQVAEEMFFS